MKNLTATQQGVAISMMIGGIVAIIAVFLPLLMGWWWDNPYKVKAVATLIPSFFIIVCIARLAKHRFFTAQDIDGSGLTQGTDKAKQLQAILQNTLEQSVIAIGVYYASLSVASPAINGSVLGCLLAFSLGRLLFIKGYSKGAVGRALGFTLTFYPTIVLAVLTTFLLF